MTAKPDDSSPQTETGRRDFLRASSIIAGGVILSRATANAQPAQAAGIPLTTKLPDFPFLTPEEIAQLTPRARELTKGDLITLGRVLSNQEELAQEEMALQLTVQDINSIQEAFANYGVGRFEGRGELGDACCCSSILCCCTASSVVKPVIKPVRVL